MFCGHVLSLELLQHLARTTDSIQRLLASLGTGKGTLTDAQRVCLYATMEADMALPPHKLQAVRASSRASDRKHDKRDKSSSSNSKGGSGSKAGGSRNASNAMGDSMSD